MLASRYYYNQHRSDHYGPPSAVFFRLQAETDHHNISRPRSLNANFPKFPGHAPTTEKNSSEYYCLPLFDVSISVSVDSTVSTSFLTQHFSNPSEAILEECTYSFPLYDGAIVSSFQCTIGDDKVLRGQVKPKLEAQATFRKAVAEHQTAALLEEHTPEIFEVRLGNLPPRTKVKIELTFVSELKADINGKGLTLIVPTSIAPRYGLPLVGQSSAPMHEAQGGLKLTVDITLTVPISSLECTSHPVAIEMGSIGQSRQVQSLADLAASTSPPGYDARHAQAKLADRDASLSKDFVLNIRASHGDLLKSQVLYEPALISGGETALMVSLNPRELLPTVAPDNDWKGEIVLLADCSGSMENKIGNLRKALEVFVKGLPQSSHFNIFSFGSTFSSLWPHSKLLTHEHRDRVLDHLQKEVQANMGGTEILTALKACVESRLDQSEGSMQLVVLTDGEVWNTEEVIAYVKEVRRVSNDRVRFFALGIGDFVSHRLIEGVGRVGGGLGEVIGEDGHGRWEEKVQALLRGVLLTDSWDCHIGLVEKRETRVSTSLPSGPHLSSASATADTTHASIYTDVSPSTIRAPHQNQGLHSFTRQTIFVMLKSGSDGPPQHVAVTITTQSGDEIKTTLPLEKVRHGSSAIHTMAAKAVINDLETGKSWLHNHQHSQGANIKENLDSLIKREAERLGTSYAISSRWTTFVAVANDSTSKEVNESRIYKAKQLDHSFFSQSTSRSVLGHAASSSHADRFFIANPDVDEPRRRKCGRKGRRTSDYDPREYSQNYSGVPQSQQSPATNRDRSMITDGYTKETIPVIESRNAKHLNAMYSRPASVSSQPEVPAHQPEIHDSQARLATNIEKPPQEKLSQERLPRELERLIETPGKRNVLCMTKVASHPDPHTLSSSFTARAREQDITCICISVLLGTENEDGNQNATNRLFSTPLEHRSMTNDDSAQRQDHEDWENFHTYHEISQAIMERTSRIQHAHDHSQSPVRPKIFLIVRTSNENNKANLFKTLEHLLKCRRDSPLKMRIYVFYSATEGGIRLPWMFSINHILEGFKSFSYAPKSGRWRPVPSMLYLVSGGVGSRNRLHDGGTTAVAENEKETEKKDEDEEEGGAEDKEEGEEVQ